MLRVEHSRLAEEHPPWPGPRRIVVAVYAAGAQPVRDRLRHVPGRVEDRPGHSRAVKADAAKIRPAEVSLPEIRVGEHCLLELGVTERRPPGGGLDERRFPKLRVFKVGPEKGRRRRSWRFSAWFA